jgi:hypothetical protein
LGITDDTAHSSDSKHTPADLEFHMPSNLVEHVTRRACLAATFEDGKLRVMIDLVHVGTRHFHSPLKPSSLETNACSNIELKSFLEPSVCHCTTPSTETPPRARIANQARITALWCPGTIHVEHSRCGAASSPSLDFHSGAGSLLDANGQGIARARNIV